jgi:hypothetical protein
MQSANSFWITFAIAGHGHAWAESVGCLELIRPGVSCSSSLLNVCCASFADRLALLGTQF